MIITLNGEKVVCTQAQTDAIIKLQSTAKFAPINKYHYRFGGRLYAVSKGLVEEVQTS